MEATIKKDTEMMLMESKLAFVEAENMSLKEASETSKVEARKHFGGGPRRGGCLGTAETPGGLMRSMNSTHLDSYGYVHEIFLWFKKYLSFSLNFFDFFFIRVQQF